MGLFGNAIQGTVFPFKSSRAQTLPFAGEESVSVSCEILSVVYKRTFRNLMLDDQKIRKRMLWFSLLQKPREEGKV